MAKARYERLDTNCIVGRDEDGNELVGLSQIHKWDEQSLKRCIGDLLNISTSMSTELYRKGLERTHRELKPYFPPQPSYKVEPEKGRARVSMLDMEDI